jgi:eukaryotic-like serine/threonine-protein kinase
MMNRARREGDSDRPTSLAFDALGRLVAHDMKGLRIWPAGSISTQPPPILQHPLPSVPGTWFTPMAKTPDGQTMVLVRSSAIFLWRSQAPDGLIPVIPPPHPAAEPAPAAINGSRRGTTTSAEAPALRFRAVQIAPPGDRIYLIDQKGLLHAWAIESTSEASQALARELDWPVPLGEEASSLALSRDGAVLALGDRAGTVTLLDTARQTVLERIKPSSGEAESLLLALAFSPSGRDLAVGSQQGTISIWSIAQPNGARLRLRLPGHRGLVTSLVFDPQGRRLASAAGIDPLVEVWDLDLIQRELMRLGLAE